MVLVLVLLALPAVGGAEMLLPPGFTARLYVSGEGFDSSGTRGAHGIPAVTTAAFDDKGALYLARVGRRYTGGETEDVWPVYRIAAGGARLAPHQESLHLYGPPVPNPQVAFVRGGHELFVTTFDRDRKIGVLYRVVDGRAELVAGGTPTGGAAPLLRQPEGAVADPAGNIYVADREQGAVVRLDPRGRVLDARWLAVQRPRLLAMEADGHLWVGADGPAEAPWQRGPGEILRVAPDGTATAVLKGPIASGLAVGPGGYLFVADRQAAQVFALAPDGRRIDVVRFTDGDAPRALVFAPVTPETRRAGMAGDLFIVTIPHGAYPVSEVVRVSGPFETLVRKPE